MIEEANFFPRSSIDMISLIKIKHLFKVIDNYPIYNWIKKN